MNDYETANLVQTIKFWTNTITLGLTRLAIILACYKIFKYF